MRLTELWARLEALHGPAYARSWAQMQVLRQLDDRTVVEALDAGVDARTVWAAVHEAMELPPSER